jgi:hypothetical protein
MAELKEPQGWVHHAAEAVTGNLLTTQTGPACDAPIAGREAVPARPSILSTDLRGADTPAYAATPVPALATGFPRFCVDERYVLLQR